ncbi:hypothetical protein Tco_0358147, partial [Tanacetum coccineum]
HPIVTIPLRPDFGGVTDDDDDDDDDDMHLVIGGDIWATNQMKKTTKSNARMC